MEERTPSPLVAVSDVDGCLFRLARHTQKQTEKERIREREHDFYTHLITQKVPNWWAWLSLCCTFYKKYEN